MDIKWTNGKIGEHESYQMIVNEMLLFITRMKKFIIIRGIFNYLINHVRAKVEYD